MVGRLFESQKKCNLLDCQPRFWVRSFCSIVHQISRFNSLSSLPDSWTTLRPILYTMKRRKYVVQISSPTNFFNATIIKLVYYPGNLSTFVEKHPEAKSYYTLAATSVKFSFPSPGSLMGVRSNTRAILKLSNCTFTYPGRTSPSLYNVSCALSLSRYVLHFKLVSIADKFSAESVLSVPMVLENLHLSSF